MRFRSSFSRLPLAPDPVDVADREKKNNQGRETKRTSGSEKKRTSGGEKKRTSGGEKRKMSLVMRQANWQGKL